LERARDPEPRRRIQIAMARGVQTHDGEMALPKMVGDLAYRLYHWLNAAKDYVIRRPMTQHTKLSDHRPSRPGSQRSPVYDTDDRTSIVRPPPKYLLPQQKYSSVLGNME
jgi:hypothetical protein